MGKSSPSLVTIQTAADALREYKRSALKHMGHPARTREKTGYDQARVSPRQVRYLMAALGRPTHRPRWKGDPMLVEVTEVALCALFIVVNEIFGLTSRAAWAGLFYNADAIRDGLRHPDKDLMVEISTDLVSVRRNGPKRDEAMSQPLAILRTEIEEFVAESLERRPLSQMVLARAAMPMQGSYLTA